jgi:lysophospholipase L1-like esterase
VKGLNIPVIDIHKEVFNSHEDYLSLFPCRSGGHYNSDGYKEVAQAVLSKIID